MRIRLLLVCLLLFARVMCFQHRNHSAGMASFRSPSFWHYRFLTVSFSSSSSSPFFPSPISPRPINLWCTLVPFSSFFLNRKLKKSTPSSSASHWCGNETLLDLTFWYLNRLVCGGSIFLPPKKRASGRVAFIPVCVVYLGRPGQHFYFLFWVSLHSFRANVECFFFSFFFSNYCNDMNSGAF
jgi:hypothetical protein